MSAVVACRAAAGAFCSVLSAVMSRQPGFEPETRICLAHTDFLFFSVLFLRRQSSAPLHSLSCLVSTLASCKHEAPLIVPNYAASQIFVYHGDAVAEWREYVTNKYLVKYLRKINVDPAAVLAAWNAIAGQQLGATLAYLNPANKVGQWLVDVPVKPYEPATYGDSYKY